MASKHHIEGKISGANYIATISLTRPCISSKWWVLQGARLVLIEVFNASLKASESGWRLSLNVQTIVPLFPVSCFLKMWMVSHYIDSELCGPGVKYFGPLYNCSQWRREWISTGLIECISILIINIFSQLQPLCIKIVFSFCVFACPFSLYLCLSESTLLPLYKILHSAYQLY